VHRQPVKKRIPVNVGFFTERLPILALAASTLLFAERAPHLALLLLFVTVTWHFVGMGLVAVGWQEMLAKVFPVQFRGRLLGTAAATGTATGILGATLAAGILSRYPFPTNFAICFIIASVFTLISWGWLALTREPPLHSQSAQVPFGEYLSRLPSVLRHDHNFANYLAARVACVLSRMGIGFLTVFAVDRWGLSDAQAGLFGAALLIGQAAANLGLGNLGDRRGHKLVLEISIMLGVLAMLCAVLAPSPLWMYLTFVAVGALLGGERLSAIAIAMEFSSPEDRPTYLGLANTVPGVFSALAPLLGAAIASAAGYHGTFLVGAAFGLLAVAILHRRVREPRGRMVP